MMYPYASIGNVCSLQGPIQYMFNGKDIYVGSLRCHLCQGKYLIEKAAVYKLNETAIKEQSYTADRQAL
jgi:hypothetical protein